MNKDEISQLFDKATMLVRTSKDFDGAINIFSEYLAVASKETGSDQYAYAFFLRGECYFNKKEYATAIQDLSDGLNIAPNDIDAYFLRGQCHYYNKSDNLAIQDFSEIIKINPNCSGDVWFWRGKVFYANQQDDSAIQDFANAIRLNPNDGEAFRYRGDCFAAKKEWSLAFKDLEEAIKINPNDGKAKEIFSSIFTEMAETAEQGDVKAQFQLAFCYDVGRGIGQDISKAIHWYTKSAEQGDVFAQYNLGVIYYHGRDGVSKDFEKATFWYNKSADQGNSNAQNSLAICYGNANGVKQDLEKMVFWYTKAAEQGNFYAQSNLGSFYCRKGATQDFQKSVFYYTKSAEQGYAVAQKELGIAYDIDRGVEKNHEKAIYWHSQAIKQNNPKCLVCGGNEKLSEPNCGYDVKMHETRKETVGDTTTTYHDIDSIEPVIFSICDNCLAKTKCSGQIKLAIWSIVFTSVATSSIVFWDKIPNSFTEPLIWTIISCFIGASYFLFPLIWQIASGKEKTLKHYFGKIALSKNIKSPGFLEILLKTGRIEHSNKNGFFDN